MDFVERTPFFWSTGGFVTLSVFAVGIFASIALGVFLGRRVDQEYREITITIGLIATALAGLCSLISTNVIHTQDQRTQVADEMSERYGIGLARTDFGTFDSMPTLNYPKSPTKEKSFGKVEIEFYDEAKENFVTVNLALVQRDGKFIIIDTDKGGELPLKGAPQKEGK